MKFGANKDRKSIYKHDMRTHSMMPRSGSLTTCVLDLRPEIRLILACARTSLRAQDITLIQNLLKHSVDWNYLLAFAAVHRLTPLLAQSLQAACPERIPDEALTYLRETYQTSAYRGLSLTGELLRIIRCLEAASIPVATYKGPLLAATVYGNPALRTYEDLDILIHFRDVWRARDVLTQQHYRPALSLSREKELEYARTHNDYPLVHITQDFRVELQWGVMQVPFRFSLDTLNWWQRFIPYTLAGHTVLSLSAEDLLLILCVHGSKHLWRRLNWVCDIAEILRANPWLDWEVITARAGSFGSRRMVQVGLLLVHKLLGAELPEPILHDVTADQKVLALTERVYDRLFNTSALELTLEEDAPLYYLRMHERWRDQARIALHFYPSLLRPLKVLRKYRKELVAAQYLSFAQSNGNVQGREERL